MHLYSSHECIVRFDYIQRNRSGVWCNFGFSRTEYTYAARTGIVAIGGLSYVITQAASTPPPSCVYSVDASAAASVPATGKSGRISITATGTGCTWTATSTVNWIGLFPSSGTESTSIILTIYPGFNSQPRTASINVAGQTFPVTQAANALSEPQRFVQLVYFAFFGRLPTEAEINFQVTNALNAGTSRTEFVNRFFTSTEFNIGGRFVAGTYVGLLNRDPEYAGWLFQRRALTQGFIDQGGLVLNFLNSAEYSLTFGSPSNEELIRLLYRYVLLREASPAEVAFQLTPLGNGSLQKRVELARVLLNSEEFRIGTGPRLVAFLLYATLLQRDGSAADRAFQAQALQSGVPVTTFFSSFLGSGEFSSLLQ